MANAEFCPIPIRQADLADDFADAIWHSETFCLNAHGVAKYALSRAVRDAGYKVVLTGEGSDEILAGYPHFRRDMLLYDSDGQDPAVIRSLLEQLEQSNPVSRGLLLPDGEAASLDRTPARASASCRPGWRRPPAAMLKMRGAAGRTTSGPSSRSTSRTTCCWAASTCARQLHGRAPVNQALYLWAKTVLPGYILTVLGDRMEMAHSVEGRVPFLDHQVVELIRSHAGGPEDPRHDREVRAARGGPSGPDGHGLSPAEAPVPEPAGDAQPRRSAARDGAGHAARLGAATGPVLRSGEGRRDCSTGCRRCEPGEQVAIDQILMMLLSACVLGERFALAA